MRSRCRYSRFDRSHQLVTRSFTPSTSRSTACTPCFAAVAPCWITLVATRLIRVTGDCFFARRLAVDFLRGAAFFAALLAPAFRRAALVPFDVPFAAGLVLLVPREAARFDAVDDLRRA